LLETSAPIDGTRSADITIPSNSFSEGVSAAPDGTKGLESSINEDLVDSAGGNAEEEDLHESDSTTSENGEPSEPDEPQHEDGLADADDGWNLPDADDAADGSLDVESLDQDITFRSEFVGGASISFGLDFVLGSAGSIFESRESTPTKKKRDGEGESQGRSAQRAHRGEVRPGRAKAWTREVAREAWRDSADKDSSREKHGGLLAVQLDADVNVAGAQLHVNAHVAPLALPAGAKTTAPLPTAHSQSPLPGASTPASPTPAPLPQTGGPPPSGGASGGELIPEGEAPETPAPAAPSGTAVAPATPETRQVDITSGGSVLVVQAPTPQPAASQAASGRTSAPATPAYAAPTSSSGPAVAVLVEETRESVMDVSRSSGAAPTSTNPTPAPSHAATPPSSATSSGTVVSITIWITLPSPQTSDSSPANRSSTLGNRSSARSSADAPRGAALNQAPKVAKAALASLPSGDTAASEETHAEPAPAVETMAPAPPDFAAQAADDAPGASPVPAISLAEVSGEEGPEAPEPMPNQEEVSDARSDKAPPDQKTPHASATGEEEDDGIAASLASAAADAVLAAVALEMPALNTWPDLDLLDRAVTELLDELQQASGNFEELLSGVGASPAAAALAGVAIAGAIERGRRHWRPARPDDENWIWQYSDLLGAPPGAEP
jgi:hypothetical protein